MKVWVAFFVFLFFFFPFFFSSWSSHKKHEFVVKSNKIRFVIRGQVPAGSVVGNVLYVPFGLTCHQNNTEYNVFLRCFLSFMAESSIVQLISCGGPPIRILDELSSRSRAATTRLGRISALSHTIGSIRTYLLVLILFNAIEFVDPILTSSFAPSAVIQSVSVIS
jgi:hypothetical protein